MLKKICLSLIICMATSQQALCGTGSSIPMNEGNEGKPARNRPNHHNNSPKINFEEIAASSYASGASSESSEEGPIECKEGTRNYSVIDLRCYEGREDIVLSPQSSKIDLHSLYNKDFPSHLANQIFNLQRDYHFSEIPDPRVFIITGTGKNRPGPNFRLKKAVIDFLQTKEFFSRRISETHLLLDEGILTVFLKKNIKPQLSENGEAVYVMGRGSAHHEIDLRDVDFSEGVNLSPQNMRINLWSYLFHQLSKVRKMQTQMAEIALLNDQMIPRTGLSNLFSEEPDTSSEEDNGVYIITGRGKKFPGYNLPLKRVVEHILELKCFQHLISDYDDTPEQGIRIFLKKNIGY